MTLPDFLSTLERSKFYGSVELKYESGRVVLVRKTESLKLSDADFRNSRGNDEHKITQ